MNSNTTLVSELSFLRKIKLRVQHVLILQTIKELLDRIGIKIVPFYLYQEGFFITKIPYIQEMTSDYSIHMLGSEDMAIIADINRDREEKYLASLKAGEKCIGIKHKGEIAAFMWITFTEIRYNLTLIHLKGNEAFLRSMNTLEPYKGRNLAPYLRYKSYLILKEMGRDTFYSISECFNFPAVRFKEKLKAKKLRCILYIELFKKNRWSFVLKSY